MDANSLNAARLYSGLSGTIKPGGKSINNVEALTKEISGSGEGDFSKALGDAAKQVSSTISQVEVKSAEMLTGKADPHSVVEALAAAELAVETAVTVRDRVVEAYQEILRMPI